MRFATSIEGGDIMFGFSTYEMIDLLTSFGMITIMIIDLIITLVVFFRHKK